MRRALLVPIILVAGCGSDSEPKAVSTPTLETPPPASTPLPPPEKPPKSEIRRPKPAEPQETIRSYTCNGETLKVLQKQGPVTVKPGIVTPGQQFQVIVRGARIAKVGLAGASELPISTDAKPDGADAVATLSMPAGAPCGNQRITVAGDVSAEATVAVKR